MEFFWSNYNSTILFKSVVFLIFKHIILEFIAFDILMSYSPLKKKTLKVIKNTLEGVDSSKIENDEDNNNIINKGNYQ